MTKRRWVLLGLLVVAVGLIVLNSLRPDDGLEWFLYVFAAPVVIVNMWEWNEPAIQKWMDGVGGRKHLRKGNKDEE